MPVTPSILEIRVIIGALFTILGAAFTFIYKQSSFDFSLQEVDLDSILAMMTSSWMLTSACVAIPVSFAIMGYLALKLKKLKIQAKAEQNKKDAQQEQVNNSLIKKNRSVRSATIARQKP